MALALALAACAPPRVACTLVGLDSELRAASGSEPAPEVVRRAACAGLSIELSIVADEHERELRFACDADGATITLAEGCGECEGHYEERRLDVESADAVYAQLASVSLAELRCTEAGPVARRLRVEGAGGLRWAECAAAAAPRWVALESLLRESARAADAPFEWPYAAEYWRDELRYAAGR